MYDNLDIPTLKTSILVQLVISTVLVVGGQAHASSVCDASFVSVNDGTWTVIPSGTAVYDTENIECALSEAASSRGSDAVVHLDGAVFHVARGIAVAGFDGTFRGNGKGATTILANGDGEDLLTEGVDKHNSVFVFDGGGTTGVTIQDLAIHVVDGANYKVEHWAFFAISRFVNGAAIYLHDNRDAVIRRIRLSSDDEFDLTFLQMIENYDAPVFRGVIVDSCYSSLSLTDSFVEHITRGFSYIQKRPIGVDEDKCVVTIENNHMYQVRSQINLVGGGVGFTDWETGSYYEHLNTSLVFDNNLFEDGWGSYLGVWNDATHPVSVRVLANRFLNASGGNAALVIDGFYASKDSVIADNTIENANYTTLGSIWVGAGTYNLVIEKNRFINIGSEVPHVFAIWLDGTFGGVSNSTIRNNDYSQLGSDGWVLDPDTQWFSGAGAILIGYPNVNSSQILYGNHIVESVSPTGTRFPLGSNLCDQVLDVFQISNVSGYKACANPNWERVTSHLEGILLEDGLLAGRSDTRP